MKDRYTMEYVNEEVSSIHDEKNKVEMTAEDVVDTLNKYNDFILELEPVLRKINGRKLFDLSYIEVSDLLNKITELRE